MIGEHIRTKRRSLGLSLQELADELSINGVALTRSALSNYELGKTVPSDHILNEIAKALGTSLEYLKYETTCVSNIKFFEEPEWIAKRKNELVSYLQLCIDKYRILCSLTNYSNRFQIPQPVTITENNLDQIDSIVEEAREQLCVGKNAISSVIGALENAGWYVFDIGKNMGLKTISGISAEDEIPFIAYLDPRDTIVLRQELLRELGAVYIHCENSEFAEIAKSRFAAAMLFPDSCAYKEFGKKRNRISLHELAIIKQKYGVSRLNVAERLEQLHIITPQEHDRLYRILQNEFILKRAPMQDTVSFYEFPETLRMRYLYADAENLVTENYRGILGFDLEE